MRVEKILNFIMIGVSVVIVLGIALFLLNPSLYHFTDERNMQREKDVHSIAQAIRQSGGSLRLPTAHSCIQEKSAEICKTGSRNCEGLVDMSMLVSQSLLTAIPTDPIGVNEWGSGYHIARNTQGKITVCAPYTEITNTVPSPVQLTID